MKSATFESMNTRRLALIGKKYRGGGLTEEEAAELAALQVEVANRVQRRRPGRSEVLDEMAARIEEMKRKARGA